MTRRGPDRRTSAGAIFSATSSARTARSWAGYVWVITPEGKKTRKWAYGKTREETREKWLKLHEQDRKGPVATKHESVGTFLNRWLAEVIGPNREPTTYVAYEPLVRLYIVPGLGKKRLDKLTVRDVQAWLNTLPTLCPAAINERTAAGRSSSGGVARSVSAARATSRAAAWGVDRR
ncbi:MULTISPECIES: N-terminal phage integrase SAM-like domain-containing protein [unclassified Nonomuraea]|uniref:N-terminal phage integrase SAM-like domain-containing protein n=1 Tax=unclassified Nonomuraea TaxID=2593643 RepID=UPI00191C2EA1|nr:MULTISPECIES: N-terminal phage integrase SAM-like domain-containing protein [unclassified Nonomuraea]